MIQGVKLLNDETLQKLRVNRVAKNTIKGVHCYDILANPNYS